MYRNIVRSIVWSRTLFCYISWVTKDLFHFETRRISIPLSTKYEKNCALECIFGTLEENRMVRAIFVAHRIPSLSLKRCALQRESLIHARDSCTSRSKRFEISLSDDRKQLETTAISRPFFWPSVLKSNSSRSPLPIFIIPIHVRIRRIDHRPRIRYSPSSRALFGGIAIHRHTLRSCSRSD